MGLRARFYCFINEVPAKGGDYVVCSPWQDDLWLFSVGTFCSFELLKSIRGLDKAVCFRIKLCKIQGKPTCRKSLEEIACLVTAAFIRITVSEDKAFGL